MSTRELKNRKEIKKKGRLLLTIVLCALAGVIGGGIAYAKYHSQQSRKGVSVASGLYFTSNCLSSIADEDWKDYQKPEDCADFVRYITSDGWQVNTTAADIRINNYENILLYNDKNLNITYDLYFMLMEDPEAGSEYQIKYTDENGTEKSMELTQAGEIRKLEGQVLLGGAATYNQVTLSVKPDAGYDPATYSTRPLAVWAVPTRPDYVAETKRLGGIVTLIPPKGQFSLESGFIIEEELLGMQWNSDGYERINAGNGFAYKFQTTGEDRDYTHYILVRWRKDLIDIDHQDSLLLGALAKDTAGTPQIPEKIQNETALIIEPRDQEAVVPPGWAQTSWYQHDTAGEWDSLLLEAPEYKSMSISFYKKYKTFLAGVSGTGVTVKSAQEFLDLVKVYDVKVPVVE